MASSVWVGGDTPVVVAELQINDGGTKKYRLIESGGSLLLQQADQGGAFSTVGTFTSDGYFTPALGISASSFADVFIGTTRITRVSTGGLALQANNHVISLGASQDLVLARNAAGKFRIANGISESNTYDITLADWGTTLSAEGVSVADAGTLNLGVKLGELFLTVGTDNIVGKFRLRGSSNAVVTDSTNDALFSTTKDNAGTINVYFDTNAYFIQNLRGGARTVRAIVMGA